MKRQLAYSVVVPIFRDADLLEDFCKEFERVFTIFLDTSELQNDIELIAVCDGGGEQDEIRVRELCAVHKFLKSIFLSRNFGQHIAISAGFDASQGESVGMTNVDQQDPISELPKFFNHLKQNNLDIVYGLREHRKGPFIDAVTSKIFHRVLDKLTDSQTPSNVSTARVMSRRFINAYNSLKESSRYIPGLEKWLGFDAGYVQTIHKDRVQGKSSYNLKSRLNLALNSILSFSDYPLRLISMTGFLIALAGFFWGVSIALLKIFVIDFQPGFTTLTSIITLLFGVTISSIGFSSLYVGRILREVQNRPTYIVKERNP